MSRPWLIWSVLVACALLILGAMGWLTAHVLGMERERSVLQAEGELEERVRLALSRMDTAASAFLLVENQRPPAHYEPYFRPVDVLTNEFSNVEPSIVFQPSPLLGAPPEFVRLHFEVAADRSLSSPQVPTGNQRDLVEASGVDAAVLAKATADLGALRALFEAPADSGDPGGRGAEPKAQSRAVVPVVTNLDLVCLTPEPTTAVWNAVRIEEVEEKAAEVQQQRAANDQTTRAAKAYQENLAYVDKGKRSQVLEDALNKAALSSAKQAAAPEAGGAMDAAAAVVKMDVSAGTRDAVAAVGSAAMSIDRQPLPTAGDEAQLVRAAVASGAGVELAKEVRIEPEVGSGVTPFRPVWLGGELFAIREVTGAGGSRFQGIWVEAAALAGHLLRTVDDLFAAASLEPVRAVADASIAGVFGIELERLQDDPRTLVTVPWRLVPGEAPSVPVPAWTPLRVSLLTGWVAVLLALLAAAALVRGVIKLSERRAAFVSSVTHELRTPLTTFQLYSDMLADGMVADESKRADYLGVLRHESGRLNHLIENVLAYSRVERGSARARHEETAVADLIERLRPQLEERVAKERGQFEVEIDGECGSGRIDTDTTAVGQILFNLVDNACKYGMPDGGAGTVRLTTDRKGRTVRFSVCDEGGGIARGDLKTVFRPFHKSAKDAAQSKPGVGLGLALSRRLARDLGGDLKLELGRESGACFVLELPGMRGT